MDEEKIREAAKAIQATGRLTSFEAMARAAFKVFQAHDEQHPVIMWSNWHPPSSAGRGSRIPRNRRLDPKRKSGRHIRPESLTMKHLGREFPGLGQLIEFRCTADGWVLIGSSASGTFPPEASIPYNGGHHHE